MAYAFVQQADGVVSGSGTSVVTGTGGTDFGANLTAGNLKVWVAFYTAGASVAITVSDANNNTASHVQVGSFYNATDSQGAVWGYVKNISGGVGATTATAASAVTFFTIYCAEYSGLDTASPYQTTVAGGNRQVNPATSADAITSTNMTPSSQPGMVFGLSNASVSAANVPNAGTGYTSRTAVWNFGSLSTRPEDQRITSTSAVAATFTVGAATDTFYTIGMIFSEAGGAAPDQIVPYFESGVEYFEPTDVTGTDTSATDWYADAPLRADVVQSSQIIPECSDNQPEYEDEALYPDYWANAPPILDVLDPPYNNHVIDPYNYDDQDEPFEFVDGPLSTNFLPDQIWAEDGSNQLEEYLDEPFEFFDGPLSASDTPQQAIVEDGSNQLEEYLDEPFEFLDAQVPANDLPQQSLYEDGQYADPEDEPFDFYDGQVPADFLPDQIWAEDGANQLEEYLDEPFEFVDGPLPGDVSQVADQLYPELADNQLEDFDEPFEFADGQVPADVIAAPDQIYPELADNQLEEYLDELVGFSHQPQSDDAVVASNSYAVRRSPHRRAVR